MERHHRLLAAAILCLGVIIRAQLWQAGHFTDDDAFISFRYADHLAHGLGFVYNAGERVLGTSSPLFTLLLTVGALLGLSLPGWAFAINLVCYAASAALLYALLEEIGRPWAGAFASLLQLFSIAGLMMAEIGGLETPLYVALILLAFFYYARGRTVLAAAVAGLAALARPEGVLLAPALGLAYVIARRRVPWRAAGVYVAVVLPWLLFAWLYFGSPVPNSMAAKWVYFRTHWSSSPLQIFQVFNLGKTRIGLNLLGLAGAVAVVMRYRRLLPVVLWLLLYLAFFLASGIVVHYWYLAPYFTPLFLLAGLALGLGMEYLAARWGAPGTRRREVATLVLVLVLAGAIGFRGRAVAMLAEREIVQGQRLLDHTHHEIGRWIALNTASRARIYIGDIGYVGYVSGRPIVDPVGIASPEAIEWNRRGDPLGFLRSKHPEVCVIGLYGRDYQDILRDPWFSRNYRVATRVREEAWPSVALPDFDPARKSRYVPDYEIFVRRDSIPK